MDSQYKTNNDGGESRSIDVKVANPKSIRSSDFLLRFLAIATTLTAAIVMGVANETKTVPITLLPGADPIFIAVPAKMRYSSAFIYFVVVNAIASAYALFSLLATMAGGKGLALFIIALDLMMVALLSSGNGAAAAIGVLGYNGNKHVRWNKVCNVFDKFCRHVAGSLVVSLIGALAFLLLVLCSILNLHRRSR
ncbi:CASP-like protein 1E2 [Magnolia sinica]|uniref:CASP-like protein 1E2 n=1 Tax=Magnolia sinica TaxID=86752 RepID=UPI00265A6CDD|nr:CASP-like protein 1E2 [Magnolia sinica]